MKNVVFISCGLLMLIAACTFDGGSQSGASRWPFDRTLIDEIDAAAKMTFEQQRTSALAAIASRPQLSAAVQVHLVQTAMQALVFDSSKQQVLLALIKNPFFLREGKQAVLDHLSEFAFEGPRQAIEQSLNRRGILPSETEMKSPRQSQGSLPVETHLTVEFQTSFGSSL